MSPDAPFDGPELPLLDHTSQLLSEMLYYTDQELIKAQRSNLIELERRASELESQVLAAQARLGALAVEVLNESSQVEKEKVAALVPWAQEQSVAIVQDARVRAAELNLCTEASPKLENLGRLLLNHFELQERLVHLLREADLGVGPSDPS